MNSHFLYLVINWKFISTTVKYLIFLPFWSIQEKKYPNHLVISGGKNRSESSCISLKNCPENTANVLIHDSARPFISTSLINKCISHLDNNDAVIVSSRATDTIIRVDDTGKISNVEDREKLYLNQTPQGFKYDLILHAHQNSSSFTTDDLSLIDLHKNKSLIINGSRYNMKITEFDDIKIAESIMNNAKWKNFYL